MAVDDDLWQEFFEATRNRPPRELLVHAMGIVTSRRSALDLGAGALNDSVYLVKEGFRSVTAVDANAATDSPAERLPADRFRFVQSTFEEFPFPVAEFDLINAQFALPFINPAHFDRVFTDIVASLSPGGIFCGQLFGDRDSWATTDPDMTFHSREKAEAALAGLDVRMFSEEDDRDGTTALGVPKRWHIFEFIARAP